MSQNLMHCSTTTFLKSTTKFWPQGVLQLTLLNISKTAEAYFSKFGVFTLDYVCLRPLKFHLAASRKRPLKANQKSAASTGLCEWPVFIKMWSFFKRHFVFKSLCNISIIQMVLFCLDPTGSRLRCSGQITHG